jgi:hypothetical protein
LQVGNIFPRPIYTEAVPRIPLVVMHGETMYELRNESAVQIVLQTSPTSGTHVSFPWVMDHMNTLEQVEKWVFWSFLNENQGGGSHYFGFGHFRNGDDFDRYIDKISDRVK